MIVGNKSNNNRNGFRVVDLCCGVGFSTRAIRDAFPQPETTVIGVDTSPEMV
jgi:trans-aconitate methyltransferase